MKNEFVEEIEIESYQDLKNRLNDTKTFRKDYIFRGLGNSNYDLIPSALRKNEFGELTINDYISENDFFVQWNSEDRNDVLKNFFEDLKISPDYYDKLLDDTDLPIVTDKNGHVSENYNEILCTVGSHDELQIKRELYLLLKFFNWVDETGLKIDVDSSIRRLIHNNINFTPKQWPNLDFFEIISLAQHYGLPTEALDWSYKYEVALYFAVKNILNDDKHDGVLWAFNYKLFEDNYLPDAEDKYKLQFYRPQYHMNPNLKAQRGLFTFIINNDNEINKKSLDEIILDDLKNNIDPDSGSINLKGLNEIKPGSKKIFYKYIIPNNIKADILDELYRDGFSEKYLFPGYDSVVLSMKNDVKSLNQLKKYRPFVAVIYLDYDVFNKIRDDVDVLKRFEVLCYNKNISKLIFRIDNNNQLYFYQDNKINSIDGAINSKILSFIKRSGQMQEWRKLSNFPEFDGYFSLPVETSNQINEEFDKNKRISKRPVIIPFTKEETDRIFRENKNVIIDKNPFKNDVGRVYIYSNYSHEILGYFDDYRMTANIHRNLCRKFKENLIYINDNSFSGYDIKFSIEFFNLVEFRYPISLGNRLLRNYIYVDESNVDFLLNF